MCSVQLYFTRFLTKDSVCYTMYKSMYHLITNLYGINCAEALNVNEGIYVVYNVLVGAFTTCLRRTVWDNLCRNLNGCTAVHTVIVWLILLMLRELHSFVWSCKQFSIRFDSRPGLQHWQVTGFIPPTRVRNSTNYTHSVFAVFSHKKERGGKKKKKKGGGEKKKKEMRNKYDIYSQLTRTINTT